jgi:integrase
MADSIDPRGRPHPVTKKPTGPPYRVRYTVDGRRRTKSGFPTRAAAALWLAQTRTDLARGTYLDPRQGQITFTAYADEWFARHLVDPATRGKIASHLRAHLKPTFGEQRLNAITKAEIRTWVAQQMKTYASWTVIGRLSVLDSILRAAVEEGRLRVNPCDGIHVPHRPGEMRFLTAAEVERIAAVLCEPQLPEHKLDRRRYRALVLLGAYSGMRLGEMTGLRRRNVDLDSGVVHVADVMASLENGHRYPRPYPKTAASRRTIKLPPSIVTELRTHLDRWAGPDFVFVGERSGRPLDDIQLRDRVWKPALVRAGIDAPMPRLHDLRHTHAALLIAQGEHPKVLQRRLGHSNIQTTLNTYGHLYPEVEDKLVAGLERTIVTSADALRVHPDLADVEAQVDVLYGPAGP